MTKRGQKPDPDELQVERVGLGYVGTIVSQGVALSFDRIVEQRGEVVGELTVERAPEGHLLIAKFSASSRADRDATARDLGGRSNNIIWRDILETFCLRVLETERAGAPFELTGTLPPAAAIPFLLWPLLPAGRPTIVFGEGGVGKSTLAAAAVVSVGSGVPVISGWRIDAPANVLVVDWEADEPEWNDLVGSVARGVGLKPPAIHYRAGVGSLTDQLSEIAEYVAKHQVKLLVLDSVGLAMPSRGDGADANEGALRLFAALRHLGVTTLLIDHVTGADMGQERAIAKPYGSVYKFNLARNIFELRHASQDPEGTLHLGLYHRKSNRTAKLPAQGLAVHHGPGEVLFETEELEGAEANSAIPMHSRIHTLLLAGGKTAKQIADAINASEATARVTLNRMREIGMVAQLPRESWGGKSAIWVAVYHEVKHVTQHVTDGPGGANEEDSRWVG